MEHSWSCIDPDTGEEILCDDSCEAIREEYREFAERRHKEMENSGVKFLDFQHQQEFHISRHAYQDLIHGILRAIAAEGSEPNLMDMNNFIEVGLFLMERKAKLDKAAKELEALVGVAGEPQAGQPSVQSQNAPTGF
jgi:hypothetical protein